MLASFLCSHFIFGYSFVKQFSYEKVNFCGIFFFTALATQAQLSPAVTSWFQNNTIKDRHYVSGNSTAITDAAHTANVQTVQYSASSVCITTCFLFATSS